MTHWALALLVVFTACDPAFQKPIEEIMSSHRASIFNGTGIAAPRVERGGRLFNGQPTGVQVEIPKNIPANWHQKVLDLSVEDDECRELLVTVGSSAKYDGIGGLPAWDNDAQKLVPLALRIEFGVGGGSSQAVDVDVLPGGSISVPASNLSLSLVQEGAGPVGIVNAQPVLILVSRSASHRSAVRSLGRQTAKAGATAPLPQLAPPKFARKVVLWKSNPAQAGRIQFLNASGGMIVEIPFPAAQAFIEVPIPSQGYFGQYLNDGAADTEIIAQFVIEI